MKFKYELWYDGARLRDSSVFEWGIYDTYEEAQDEAEGAMSETMDYWEMEDEEYDPDLFEIKIEEV